MNTFTKLAIAGMLAAVTGGTAVAQELHLPNLSYRTGPFAATGTPIMNGQRDYMIMLNERDGGIGGIPINFEECETGYNTEKGVECYERLKATALVTQPWSTGIALQVLPKTNVDQIPIFGPGYGFSPMSDGRTFQWAFNPPASYWDGAYMIVDHLAGGDMSTLSGKKIAFLHLDHPFGKEPLPVLEQLAATHGFELLPIPVGLAEMQNQAAQWLQIRREQPDFVVMWGWGAMNAGAITEAVKTRYPMDQFVGIWWAGHTDDLQLVGEAGKGYRSISWSMPQNDSQVMADIQAHVVDKGLSLASDEERGEVFYQRGLVISMMLAEGVRTAQEMHGTAQITPAQLRDGLANLNITAERLEELGMTGMVPPFSTNCANHTGHAGAWMLQWDGTQFVQASDLLTADRAIIDPIQAEKAAEYAAANAPWPLNETCNPS
jgi:branched-chain amino acid transport system substrate-binding protein